MKGIDGFLYNYMRTDEFRHLVENDCNLGSPVTLTYALERLVILHTKLWNLEDQARDPNLTDEQLGRVKRQIDFLNGTKRPMLIAAIGEMFARAVKEGNEDLVRESNLKDYKARGNNENGTRTKMV